MIHSIQRLSARLSQLPSFSDEEQVRRASLLNSLLAITLAGTWLFVLAVIATAERNANPMQAIMLGAILTVFVAVLSIMLRRGKATSPASC